MLASISLPLFFEWMDYYEVEPFGEERADLRCAIISHVIANVNAAKGKRFKIEDFMPKFEGAVAGTRRPKQTAGQMKTTFMAFAKAHNRMLEKKTAKTGDK